MNARRITLLTLAVVGIAFTGLMTEAQAESPLAKTWKAHGGLDAWQAKQSMSYVLKGFPLSPQAAKPNKSTVDLKNRFNRIEGEGFTVGYNGNVAWAAPSEKAAGLPARFFSLGSFYFIGMPFVFSDPGVELEDIGLRTFDGRKYRVVSVKYSGGTGYTSKDTYELYLDPKTDRLYLINHSVTEQGVEVERVTWVFNTWQNVEGLLVPSSMTFYQGWNPEKLPAQGAQFSIESMIIKETPVDVTIFDKPQDAVIDTTPHHG